MTEHDDTVQRRLIDAYRSKGPSQRERERVFAALSSAIATGAAASAAASMGAASKGGLKAFLMSHPLALSGAGLGVGCAIAVGVWFTRAPAPSVAPARCDAPCASAQASANTAPLETPPAPASSSEAPTLPAPAAPDVTPDVESRAPIPRASGSKRPAAHSGDLAAEAALLHQAHSAYRRGQPAETLTLLREHAAKYPTTQLSVERGTLKVLALCALNRVDDARRTAATLPPRSTALRGSCAER
jgi:hypothetical protein